MTDKQLATKIRTLVKEYKTEYYPDYKGEKITNKEAWVVVWETVIR